MPFDKAVEENRAALARLRRQCEVNIADGTDLRYWKRKLAEVEECEHYGARQWAVGGTIQIPVVRRRPPAQAKIPQRWADGNGLSKTNRLAAMALIRACHADDTEAAMALLPDNAPDAIEIIIYLAQQSAGYMQDFGELWHQTVPQLLDYHVQVINESDSPD